MTRSSSTNTVADESILQRKTIHPYDLSVSDNPGTLISQVLFTGNNYEEWARELRTALRARKKFGFVDGTIKRPSDVSGEIEDWWTINSLLVSWIRNTIEASLRRDISSFEVAKDLWDDIREQYGVVNGPRVHQLKFELVNCKQRNMSINTYYGKLKKLWDGLGEYEKADTCTCNGCSCGAKEKAKQKQENNKVYQFLMGLDEEIYGGLRSTLLAKDPLPTLNQVYSTMLQNETARQGPPEQTTPPEIANFTVQIDSRRRDTRRTKLKNSTCSICGKKGHTVESCFIMIGYPIWWKGARVDRENGGLGEMGGRSSFTSVNGPVGVLDFSGQSMGALVNNDVPNNKIYGVNGGPPNFKNDGPNNKSHGVKG